VHLFLLTKKSNYLYKRIYLLGHEAGIGQTQTNRRKRMNKGVIPIRLYSVFILCIFSVFVFLPASAFSACPDTMTSYWKLDGELNPPYLNEIDPDFDGECLAPGACPDAIDAITSGAVGEGAQVFERYTSTTGTGINVPGNVADAPFNWAATDSFTIEYWIKREPGGFTSNEVVVGRNINPTTGLHWWTGLTSSGVAAFELLDRSNEGPARVDGTSNLADGIWHHVVAVRDAVRNKNLLYVDGVLEGSADFNYAPTGIGDGFATLSASLNIGWLNLSNGFHFNGIIDEIAIYDVALPQSIIKGHYVLMIPYCDILPSSIGVFRKGAWYLDANGTYQWDAGDTTGLFGISTDMPVVGDWNGDGLTDIGVFRRGAWYLDSNGSGNWNAGDTIIAAGSFGISTDKPVTGDWNGDGYTNIGVFRNGTWYLDYNGTNKWDAGDKTASFGISIDIPVTGDWNGDGKTSIGVFRRGVWYLDYNGTNRWDAGDKTFSFGTSTDIPVTGDWNGDGIINIGVFRNGAWYLDYNGNGMWDSGVDIVIPIYSFGSPGDIPVTGVWK
jgi:hypothetical protein